jgi:hypothetical protein
LIFGEIFVSIASGIGCSLVSGLSLVACELAAVCYDDVFGGLVATLGGEVLDFADDGLAVQDFAENDMFPVEMGGWDRGDEELGAVGAYVPKSVNVNLNLGQRIMKKKLYQDQH